MRCSICKSELVPMEMQLVATNLGGPQLYLCSFLYCESHSNDLRWYEDGSLCSQEKNNKLSKYENKSLFIDENFAAFGTQLRKQIAESFINKSFDIIINSKYFLSFFQFVCYYTYLADEDGNIIKTTKNYKFEKPVGLNFISKFRYNLATLFFIYTGFCLNIDEGDFKQAFDNLDEYRIDCSYEIYGIDMLIFILKIIYRKEYNSIKNKTDGL